jgi:hypothetical protein
MSLGKLYHLVRLCFEWLRIGLFQLSERIGQQRILWELVRLRWRSLVVLLALIVLATTLDNRFGQYVVQGLVKLIPIAESPAFQTFIAVVATAIATITAILLSISLVALENVGQRYGARLTRYLIHEERVGRYVLDLLTVTLLFSLWLLLSASFLQVTPYISVIILLGLATLCIVSLVVYRVHALAFLTPSAAVDTLLNEITRMFWRLPVRPHEGSRATTDWLRRKVVARITDLEDLANAVILLKDQESVVSIIRALFLVLDRYSMRKQQVTQTSVWFPIVQQPISATDRFVYTEQRRLFDQTGRGRPVQQVQDTDWLEKYDFEIVQRLLEKALDDELWRVFPDVMAHLSSLITNLVDTQQYSALSKTLELYKWLVGTAVRNGKETTIKLLNASSTIGHHVVGMNKSEHWAQEVSQVGFFNAHRQDIWRMEVPAMFEKIALNMYDKLQLEVRLEGQIATPADWVHEELTEEMQQMEKKLKTDVFQAAVNGLTVVFNKESYSDGGLRVTALYAIFWLWHCCLLTGDKELTDALPANRFALATEAVIEAKRDNEWLRPMLDELASCAFLLMAVGEYNEVPPLVTPLSVFAALGHETTIEYLDAYHRYVGVCSYALLVSELRGQTAFLDTIISDTTKLLGNDCERWKLFQQRWEASINPGLAFTFGLQESIEVKYHEHFLRIWRELKTMKGVTVDGYPGHTRLDHPSEFIQRHSLYGTIGATDCAKEFLQRLLQHLPPECKEKETDSA